MKEVRGYLGNIEARIEEFKEVLELNKRQTKIAFGKAVKRTITHFRTKITREIAKEIGVNLAIVRGRVIRGRRDKIDEKAVGIIVGFLWRIPLSIAGKISNERPVTVKGQKYPQAFVRDVKKPRRGNPRLKVLERRGKNRYPLIEKEVEIAAAIDTGFLSIASDVHAYLDKQLDVEFKKIKTYVK